MSQTSALVHDLLLGEVSSVSSVAVVTDVCSIPQHHLPFASPSVLPQNYPLTTSVAVALGRAGVVTPMGPLLTTGLLAPHKPTLNEPVAASQTALQPLQGSAFRLLLVQQPQDGSADACLSLELAPSYVTYNAAAVEGVSSFFATSQALDLTSLQVRSERFDLACSVCNCRCQSRDCDLNSEYEFQVPVLAQLQWILLNSLGVGGTVIHTAWSVRFSFLLCGCRMSGRRLCTKASAYCIAHTGCQRCFGTIMTMCKVHT